MAEGEKSNRMSVVKDDAVNVADNSTTSEDHSKQELVSPFITTSDVVNNLNMQLAMLSDGLVGGGEVGSTSDTTTNIGSTGPIEALSSLRQKPRFELNKRLPDGSAVPATPEEISAADFRTKLEQAASFVSQLATPRDRQYWAEQQRLLGNRYFESADYKSAMDVYLTCLLVKENTPDFVQVTLFPGTFLVEGLVGWMNRQFHASFSLFSLVFFQHLFLCIRNLTTQSSSSSSSPFCCSESLP